MSKENPYNTYTNKKAMLKAMTLTMGNVREACKKVKISRQTHYVWLRTDEEYKEAIDEIVEGIKDWVESKIREHIANDNPTVTIFYAKTKMKDRGYVEQQDHNIAITKGKLPDWLDDE